MADGFWSVIGSYPPRRGNYVTALIDGELAFKAIAEDIERAQRYVYLTGAFINLDFRPRPVTHPSETLRTLLLAKAKSGVPVRIHFWNPDDKVLGKQFLGDSVVRCTDGHCLEGVNAGTGSILARWDDAPGGKFGCHHQKTFIIDGQIGYVGGINSVQNYWDTTSHDILNPGRFLPGITASDVAKIVAEVPPLHDVFMRLDGPCVADVEESFVQYWNAASRPLAEGTLTVNPKKPREYRDGLEAQIVRTVGKGATCKPAGEQGIREFYLKAVEGSKQSIYLENQYFYDAPIAKALRKNFAQNENLYAIAILSAKPDTGIQRAFTTLQDARKMSKFFEKEIGYYQDRMAFYSLWVAQEIGGQVISSDVYIHAKVGIFDDEWITVGSANVNSFSMEKHSEMNVVVRDRELAWQLRRSLWFEHLRQDLAQSTTPHDAFRLWQAVAQTTDLARQDGRVAVARIVPFNPPYSVSP